MASLNFNLQFETSEQNIFGSGDAFSFTDDRFLGIDFDESVSRGFTIPLPIIDDIEVGFSAFANGTVGLQSSLELDGGSVDALIPVDLFLEIPDDPVQAGDVFTIQSGFSVGTLPLASIPTPSHPGINTAPYFTTVSPSASYNLDFIFDVAAGLDVNPGFDVGFDVHETANLISFDSTDSSFTPFNNALTELSVSIPNVTTVGTQTSPDQLTSSGSDEFVTGSLDLDFIATRLFGLPSLEGDVTFLDFTIPVPFLSDIDIEAGLNYNFLDIEASANLSLIQDFSLNNITLPALLTLEDGTTIPFNVGEEIEITVPDHVGESLDIDALIDANALFRNQTDLGLDFNLDFLVGEFELELPILPDPSIGPLFEESVELFETSFDVFDSTFNLEGFNQEEVSFHIQVVPAVEGDGLSAGYPAVDTPDTVDITNTVDTNDVVDVGDSSADMTGDLQGVGNQPGSGVDSDAVEDTLTPSDVGTSGNDRIVLGADDDQIGGRAGDDVIFGGAGDDRITGQNGDDLLFGEDGDDVLWGEAKDDTLNGGNGSDRLFGQGDHDTLIGGRDRDLLEGGRGNDTLTGGEGADIFQFSANDFRGGVFYDEILDFNRAEGDRIRLVDIGVNDIALTSFGSGSNVILSLNSGGDIALSGVAVTEFDISQIDFNATRIGCCSAII